MVLKFRKENKDIFDAILNGVKKIETRAGTAKYEKVKVRESIVFSCGKERFKKKVLSVEKFKTIEALVKKYKPLTINPNCKTLKELTAMYMSFPNYKEKIKKYGLLAFELE